VGIVALVAAGCGAVGRVTTADVSHGKQLFMDPKVQCSGCHTLADAHAQGTIGPNLDDAFGSAKEQGFSQQTMADVIRGQIAYPEAPMPANLVSGQDANDVALYVAKCSANPNCGVTASKAAPTTTTAPAPTVTTPQQPTSPGKQVFLANCGSCHTLKDAGTTGKVGPNLDQLKPPKDVVVRQVTNGGAIMLAFKGKLTPEQIASVADYVSKVAGR
jgi:cytochrome c6